MQVGLALVAGRSSLLRQSTQLLAFPMVTDMSYWANPIMGPPEMTRAGVPLKPPASSMRWEKGVPTGASRFTGFFTALPVTVITR